ncbi:hypothetical protein GCM10023116_21890 [Kistimonas scapharcae]|uniref:Uncharacterized protein n=1 Tax=Kistimonas scapharcae TaxID=1036133 RepID=A0ABP8V0Z9_9GAMM
MVKYSKNKPFWLGFIIMIFVLFTSSSLLNFLVDPYGVFRFVELRGFNLNKEDGIHEQLRYSKAMSIPRVSANTVIFGTSVVMRGINPADFNNDYGKIYNNGVYVLRLPEAVKYLERVVKYIKPDNVIYGLDFFTFKSDAKYTGGFKESWTDQEQLLDLSALLFGGETFVKSLETVLRNLHSPDLRLDFKKNGYRYDSELISNIQNGKDDVSARRDRMINHWSNSFLNAEYPKVNLEYLQEFIDICKENNINLKLYISPAHWTYYETIWQIGEWESYESWIRTLTDIADENSVELFDYSGWNDITTERMSSEMKYWIDPGHFSSLTGVYIIDGINDKYPDNNIKVRLKNETVESILDDKKKLRREFVLSNRERVDNVVKNLSQ